jgi:hypothetical protein
MRLPNCEPQFNRTVPFGRDDFEFTEEAAEPATLKPGYAQLVTARVRIQNHAGPARMLRTTLAWYLRLP